MLRSCNQHQAAATSRLQLRVRSFTLFVLSPTGRLAALSPPAIVGETQPLAALINLKDGSAAHVPQHPAATFLRRGQEAASAAAAASQLARPFPTSATSCTLPMA